MRPSARALRLQLRLLVAADEITESASPTSLDWIIHLERAIASVADHDPEGSLTDRWSDTFANIESFKHGEMDFHALRRALRTQLDEAFERLNELLGPRTAFDKRCA